MPSKSQPRIGQSTPAGGNKQILTPCGSLSIEGFRNEAPGLKEKANAFFLIQIQWSSW